MATTTKKPKREPPKIDLELEVWKDGTNNNEPFAVAISVTGKIVSASRPRVARGHSYYAEPYRSFKEVIKKELTKELDGQSLNFLEGLPISAALNFNFPLSAENKRKLKKDPDFVYFPMGDVDNLFKAYTDFLIQDEQGGVIVDDRQITEASIRKVTRADIDTPFVTIFLTKAGGGNVND